ncbi:branched-chain amino acid transport system II carrier protein [Aquibacillus koreensis]|uniref:Branched-chain amino acid transport system carrier protein n=1 Tax=Aquibacillus koreensis TaxID=279446 RepID=A0A9X3WP58_9BACI|nr:branched-chain amino acid transport system II carrier protein [Aquibacillus koreensis]MCT2538242.1 branched-chain amino acid transport system II carrier protein [Aquibacillus koreensis]MDC3420814.1 branched-chain amino acid transport system II carrier protein [Aquibacillus koreensis]
MNKHIFFTGFMLFALFFGAGNLIYPPTLGIEAGTSFWSAMLGFIVTGVGLPILAITAIGTLSNEATDLGSRVHPSFGYLFSSVIYLAIGPFFGIPRAANVAYEMGITPISLVDHRMLLLGFTIIFFLIVYFLSLNPSKLVDRIGQWLTPALVIAIAALSIGALFMLSSDVQAPMDKYEQNAFFVGFVEGYLTMDAIGAIAFGLIVITSLKEAGIRDRKVMVASTLKAGLVAGVGLTLVYSSIGWIGSKMATAGSFDNGGQILISAAAMTFGDFGKILLGIIVFLACLTTSIGLTVACGQFFTRKTSLSYKTVIGLVSLISFLIANLGLSQIISISIPVLVAIYPIAIVLILLAFLNQPSIVHRFVVGMTSIVSVYDGFSAANIKFDFLDSIYTILPFQSIGLSWIAPALIGWGIGKLIHTTGLRY